MSQLSFLLSTLFALAGVGSAILGITGEEWKLAAVGLVLILGAAVFATLYTGTRLSLRKMSHVCHEGPSGGTSGEADG